MEKINLKNEIVAALLDMRLHRTKFGYDLRKKRKSTTDLVEGDAANSKLRINRLDFISAVKSTKLLRDAVRPLLKDIAPPGAMPKTVQHTHRILKTDKVNKIGKRNVHYASLWMFRKYELNHKASLNCLFYAPYKYAINRAKGEISLSVPPFSSRYMLAPYPGATHFKLITAACEIDFLNNFSNTSIQETDHLLIEHHNTNEISHLHSLTPQNPHTMFLILSMQYFQEVNGKFYRLMTKTKNGVQIVDVDHLEPEEIK